MSIYTGGSRAARSWPRPAPAASATAKHMRYYYYYYHHRLTYVTIKSIETLSTETLYYKGKPLLGGRGHNTLCTLISLFIVVMYASDVC